MISLIQAAVLPFPATCANCGNSNVDCVDFGVTKEYDGALLICVNCFDFAIVETQRGVTNATFEQVAIDRDQYKARVENFEQRLEGLTQSVLTVVGDFITDSASLLPDVDLPRVTLNKEIEPSGLDLFN